jgi:hypothetical protein
MKPRRRSGRCSFDSETVKSFPPSLLFFRYSYPTGSQADIQLARHHVTGTPVPVLDLSGWEEIEQWIVKACELNVAQRLRGVNISGHTEITMQYLHKLHDLFPTFDTLHLNDLTQLHIPQLCDCIVQFSCLHTLSLQGLTINDACFGQLANSLRQLKHLDISRCSLLTNSSLRHLSRVSFDLTTLSASTNPNFTVEGANELIMSCQQLHKLDFSDCDRLTFFGIIISHQGMIQYGSWNVKDINLSNCKDMHIESLMWLEAANPYLHHVQLAHVRNLNDAVVGGMASSCEQLRLLNIESCRKVGNSALLEIARNCRRHLTDLNISNINKHVDSTSIKEIMTHCSGLTALNLSGNKRVTDEAFSAAEDKMELNSRIDESIHTHKHNHKHKHSQPQKPPRLTSLNIENCARITTFGLSVIAERHPTLTFLNISGLKNVTDISLNVIGMSCGKRLLTLIADDCEKLTDVGIGYLCKHSRLLETLSLSSSTRFTDSWYSRVKQYTDTSVEHILFGLARLRVLKMRNQCSISFTSPRLTVDYVNRARINSSLQEVDLSGCDYLNEVGLAGVFGKLYSLASLWLTDGKAMPWVRSPDFLSAACRHSKYSACIAVCGTGVGSGQKKQLSKLTSVKSLGASSVGSDRRSSALSVASSSSVGNMSRTTAGSHAQQLKVDDDAKVHSVIDASEIDTPKYVQVLVPLSNRDHLQFRDMYVRKRLLSLFCARIIQQRFRLYRFWKKIRRFVRARQIASWYRQILDYRAYVIMLRTFVEKRAVNMIFKTFRNSNLRVRARASCRIQRTWRGCCGRKLVKIYLKRMGAATAIQSVVRGMLYRLSDQYILSQLYLKLPPFWRTVMDAAPAEKYYEKHHLGVEIYQAHHHTQNMLDHIKHEITDGRKLAPKLPFIVPQPFDKKPYVSLSDGRKIDIFKDIRGLLNTDGMRGAAAAASRRMALNRGIHSGSTKGGRQKGDKPFYKAVMGNPRPRSRPSSPSKEAKLLTDLVMENTLSVLSTSAETYNASGPSQTGLKRSDQQRKTKKPSEPLQLPYKEHIPVHMFNIVFWPYTEPLEAVDTTTDQFDPSQNSFEVIQNRREALFCMLCDKKLRVVQCKTCHKGYCFDCAFR